MVVSAFASAICRSHHAARQLRGLLITLLLVVQEAAPIAAAVGNDGPHGANATEAALVGDVAAVAAAATGLRSKTVSGSHAGCSGAEGGTASTDCSGFAPDREVTSAARRGTSVRHNASAADGTGGGLASFAVEAGADRILRTNGTSASARRLPTAIGVSFETGPVSYLGVMSNIEAQPKSSSNINVHAGVVYPKFDIMADGGGLGTDQTLIRVKLVPYDLTATMKTCAETQSLMGAPFDGTAGNSLPDPQDIENEFVDVAFPHAGLFRLCYSGTEGKWQELEPTITVYGSEFSNNKFWCSMALIDPVRRPICSENTAPDTVGCGCSGKLEGLKRMSTAPYELKPLGINNRPSPFPWKMSLTEDAECGNSFATPFRRKVSDVEYSLGFEIHDFYIPSGGVAQLGTWKLCYCVGFDRDNGDATNAQETPCFENAAGDFMQFAGKLTTVDVRTIYSQTDTPITVYPTLRFSLEIQCGATRTAGEGGCVTTDVSRYKIIPRSAEADLPYYDSNAGCQFMTQAETYNDGAKVVGGHIAPQNCAGAAQCIDKPEIFGPRTPTWDNVQLDATYDNAVMIPAEYDLCYCDEDCTNSVYWFKAGQIKVMPVTMYFAGVGSVLEPNPVLATPYYIIMEGLSGAGGWSLGPPLGAASSLTREMKILRDEGGFVDKTACLTEPQPNVVSGHRLISGNTDYTSPVETINQGNGFGKGQRYGEVMATDGSVKPSIKILEAGWFAICYCDNNCNEMLNWAVFGRQLVMGPLLGQSWVRFSGVPFNLDVKGWGLNRNNRLRILSPSNKPADCGQQDQSDRVWGPFRKAEMIGESFPFPTLQAAKITNMNYHPSGTEITFSHHHGLTNEDYITLSQISVRNDIYRSSMYNAVHKVFVSCDDPPTKVNGCHKILIQVKFTAVEFPDSSLLDFGQAKWDRSSQQEYKDIKVGLFSPDGRGYVVCWSPGGPGDEGMQTADYIGQAGEITVKPPTIMQAKLGLTTRMPVNPGATGYANAGAPAIIWFQTNDIAHYEQAETGSMSLKIVIQPGRDSRDNGDGTFSTLYEPALEFRDYQFAQVTEDPDNNERSEANQAFCGKIFAEMWSSDPDGFPQPDGCYYDQDTTMFDYTRDEESRLNQIHIVFSPRNHLKRNTQYQLVMNFNIFTRLDKDYPQDGALFIWSMDAYEVNPYGVVEKGEAYPAPEGHAPPRDQEGNLALTDPDTTDPMFHETEGFKLLGPDGTEMNLIELKSYCKGENNADPANSPDEQYRCIECTSEADCGNFDKSKKWCTTPIDNSCPQADGTPLNAPMFLFNLRAKSGTRIENTHHLRLWFHPLSAWDMALVCQNKVNWAPDGCTAPGSSSATCAQLTCSSEAVLLTTVVGQSIHKVNSMKLTFGIMDMITDSVSHTIAVGSNVVPEFGFFPQKVTAEVMKADDSSPDYWGLQKLAPGGGRLYKLTKIISASIVTFEGDGNLRPFKGQLDNRLYIRFVMGATLFAEDDSETISLEVQLPLYISNEAQGYKCVTTAGMSATPDLKLLEGIVPNGKGRLGGDEADETAWDFSTTTSCRLEFRPQMVLYAFSVVYFEIAVNNPRNALKRDDPTNFYTMTVTNLLYNLQAPTVTIGTGDMLPSMAGFGGSVSVLGKLSEMIIAPDNWGTNQENWLSVFFMTEQEVGTMTETETEVWVDAPADFNFRLSCAVRVLEPNYHIPEANPETYRLPIGTPPECNGATNLAQENSPRAGPDERVYNRAKVKTVGRLLKDTLYGFQLKVINAPIYIRSQQDDWRIWTYNKKGAGVDGGFETCRYNQQDFVGGNTSFGIYPYNMPPENFQVSIADLRPSFLGSGRPPTEITFYMKVQVRTQKALRVIAPSGYEWAFEQVEFRYKKAASGVNPDQVIADVDADLPISGTPAKPIARPMNVFTIDYMAGFWQPGVQYGFGAKIRVPNVPPTASANLFMVEFGYMGTEEADRREGGVFKAPLVSRLINGAVSYTTNIAGMDALISFEFRTITHIPRSGGIMITGPPNFVFDALCQPKPAPGYPELPYDSDCLFEATADTSTPEITIVAGLSGIPPKRYKFTLTARNPSAPVELALAGEWVINSYSLLSPKPEQRVVLDQSTVIPGYPVNRQMANANMRDNMPAWEYCYYPTPEQLATMPTMTTNCENQKLWQFYYADTGGLRNDQPGQSSAIVINFLLDRESDDEEDMLVRAPSGYVFNPECQVEIDSARIFNANAEPGSDPPLQFIVEYSVWPVEAELVYCKGKDNQARIRIKQGLLARRKYVFRIAVLQNPMVTPEPNLFALEYNGESSELFEGIEIWAFKDTALVPKTTAASISWRPTINLVTMYLRPANQVGGDSAIDPGMVRVKAPEGFLIRAMDQPITACYVKLYIHPTEAPNISAQPPGEAQLRMQKWAEFFAPQDIECKGDETPSSRARLLFHNQKYLKPGVWYVFELKVWNPEVTDAVGQQWEVTSYKDATLNKPIDWAFFDGFPINDMIEDFMYMKPSSYNALMYQQLDFNISFPETVEIGDIIEIVAPVTYMFSLTGDSRCPKYLYLTGSLQRTIPECGANSMSWHLEEETVPARSIVRFLVQVRNPAITPSPAESNMFRVRVMSSDLTVKSSRMIAGYQIVPEPLDVSVILCPAAESLSSSTSSTSNLVCDPAWQPTMSCREVVDLISAKPCEAAGSRTAIRIFFTPTMSADALAVSGRVGNVPFDFSNAKASGDNVNEFLPHQDFIMMRRPVKANVVAAANIEGILNPSVTGTSLWTITTYRAAWGPVAAIQNLNEAVEMRGDEKLDFPSFDVLGYIQTMTSSMVNPIYYRALAATVTFELRPHIDWGFGDVLRMTRPPGYTMLQSTLQTFSSFRVGSHGLDDMRKFSNNYQNPPDYWMVLDAPVTAFTLVLFSVKADLPQGQEASRNWFFRNYRVEFEYDPTDGELIDDSQVPYPWLGRDITLYGSNDGAFSGFLLVGEIDFQVLPDRKTPGADIRLKIDFKLPAAVEAQNDLILDVTAPTGYVFADSCLAVGSPQFSKCSGFRNTASLTSVLPRLAGSNRQVTLAVTNPGETPISNIWTLALFMDRELGATNYVNYGTETGYEIESMKVTYKGNNQLGETSVGFFTLTPMSPSPGAVVWMVFYPPPNQGYNLNCADVQPLSFREVARCESYGRDDRLELRLDNATLYAEQTYTIGIGVSNPGGPPAPDATWGLLLQDQLRDTFDGNLRIANLEALKAVPMECGLLGWVSADPRVITVIQIQLRVTFPMQPGSVTLLDIQAPSGVMYNEDVSSVVVSPQPLPTTEAQPVQVLGDTLRFNLDTSKEIPVSMYNIRFEVSNPGVYPSDNTWRLRVTKDIEVEFQHVFTGYTQGQQSPFQVATQAAMAGGTQRKHALPFTAASAVVAGGVLTAGRLGATA